MVGNSNTKTLFFFTRMLINTHLQSTFIDCFNVGEKASIYLYNHCVFGVELLNVWVFHNGERMELTIATSLHKKA